MEIIVQNLSPEEFSLYFLKSTGKTQSQCCRQIFSPKICANHVHRIWVLMSFWCISGRTQLWFWLALNSCCFACTETAANFSNLQNKTMNQNLYKITNLPTIQHRHTKKIKLNPPNWTTHITLETKSHIEEMQVNEVTFLRVCCIFEICKNQPPPIGLNKSTSCVGLASTFSFVNFPLPFSAAAACPFLSHSQQ